MSQPTSRAVSTHLKTSLLVGREMEIADLEADLEDALSGQGGLVFITGEAGIGKTRLAAELRSVVLGQGCQWLEGRYERQGSNPLQPYGEALRDYLRTAPQGSLASIVGPYSTEIAKSFPVIAADLDTAPPPDLAGEDPEMSRQRYLEAICHLFCSISRKGPLVLFLDDLQWSPSLDLLQALAEEAPKHPFLLVGAYRDSELRDKPILSRSVLAMNRRRLFRSLPLRRLGREQMGQIVERRMDRPVSEHLVDMVFERAEGNPFFVEELVSYLLESGALTLDGEIWDIPDAISLHMPDSIRAVVEERLERLDEETRKTLAIASVIGQEFTMSILQEVIGVDEEVLVDAVDRAVGARVLVLGSSVGRETYAFADNQIRDVLYQDTGIARRRRYHLQVGEAIEKVQVLRPEEHYDALAHHFLEGNNLEKAVEYSIQAGDQAWRQSVFSRAKDHYQIAAELLEELGEESERTAHVQAQLGINLVSVSAVGVSSELTRKGIQMIGRALDTFVSLGNFRRAAELHRALAGAYPTGGGIQQDYQEAGRHGQAAVDLLATDEDSLEKAIAHETLAFWYERCLDLDRAEELAWEALRIAEAVQDPDAITRVCTTLGLVLVQRGHLDQGLAYAKRGFAAAQKGRTPWFRERAAAFPIVVYPWLADVGHYLEWFNRWENLQGKAPIQRHQLEVPGVMAAIAIQGGDSERAQDLLAKTSQFGPDPGFEWQGAALTARHYGQLLLDQGVPRRSAEELLRTQWEYCRERGAITFELGLLPPLCESYLRQGRLEEAHACLGRAREILAMPENWRGLTAAVAVAGALLATVEERWEEAESGFQEATETNQLYGLLYDKAGAMYKWAVMYIDRSANYPEPLSGRVSPDEDRARGLELLEQSLAIFQQCDVKEDVERVVALQDQVRLQSARGNANGLTEREIEVLRLVAAGKTNPEIARDLFISATTVTTHVSNILRKINAANRAQAASYAEREGLV